VRYEDINSKLVTSWFHRIVNCVGCKTLGSAHETNRGSSR